MDMTQRELAAKYDVPQCFVSLSLRGIEPNGKKAGVKRSENLYPEKEAAAAILKELREREFVIRKEFEERKHKADRVEGIMRANGLLENARYKL